MENASNYLDYYRSQNLVVFPLESRSKAAIIKDWPNLSPNELFKHFDKLKEYNIGLRLDNLIVLDIERAELWNVFFLQPLEVVASKTWIQQTGKGYHVLFRGETKPLRIDGLVEIRSGPQQYIVVAPSVHPNGSRYAWVSDIEKTLIATISQDDLERLRHKLEVFKRFRKFIEAMLGCWKRYHRHFLSLWLSGVFRRINLDYDDAELVLKTIVLLSRDEELEDRIRCLRDSYEKTINQVKGWSGLRDELLQITGSEKEVIGVIKLIPVFKQLLFEVKTLREVCENAGEISYISYPLLPKKCLIVLSGKGGVGKSMLSLYLAYCIANGKRLFDYYDCMQTKTLLVDNENNPSILKQRSELLNLNPLDSVDVINFTNWRLDKKGAISKLRNLIKTNGYGLVVLDNFTVLTSTVEENKSTEISNILTRLRKIAYETNCTILLVHHLRKGLAFATNPIDELRGSSVMVNEPDLVLLLEREAVTGDLILKSLKNRLGESFSMRIRLERDEDSLRPSFKEELAVEIDTNLSKIAKSILDMLKQSPTKQLSAKTIIEELPYSRSQIYRALKYLDSLKAIHKVDRGKYALPHTLDEEV